MLRLHDGGATLFTPTLLGNETRACTEVSLACLLLAFAWHFRESQPCWRSELRALRSHLHACMHGKGRCSAYYNVASDLFSLEMRC